MPVTEVRGLLVDYLDRGFFKLTQAAISNVLEGLKAKARLSYRIDPPAWIDDEPPTWNPADVLACRNVLINLPALVAGLPDYQRPATPRFFTMSALDYNFRIDAPRPDAWLQFLAELWPEDQQSIEVLQEWSGYILTPDTRQQKILGVFGPKRAGKGVIGRVLRELIGVQNVVGPTLSSLAGPFGLWSLWGKSLAIISDARLSGRTDQAIVVERLLSISGEDCVTVDRKCLTSVTGKLPCRLMLCSNELPRLGDASGALASRMIVLRLTKSFYGCEDHNLTDKLLVELPGILLWSIDGWRRLRERGHFQQPDTAADLLGQLEDLGSPVAEFLREECTVGPECEVSRRLLYGAYHDWAKAKGREYIEDEAGFGRNLRAVLPTLADRKHRIDGQQTRYYGGITLRD
jgi:putative DNA primase/helicase